MLNTDEALKKGPDVRQEAIPAANRYSVRRSSRVVENPVHQPELPAGRGPGACWRAFASAIAFLQTLVVTSSTNPTGAGSPKLIDVLGTQTQPWFPQLDARLHPDTLPAADNVIGAWRSRIFGAGCTATSRPIGKLIVLESGEGPELPIEGHVYISDRNPRLVGTLRRDGTIVGHGWRHRHRQRHNHGAGCLEGR